MVVSLLLQANFHEPSLSDECGFAVRGKNEFEAPPGISDNEREKWDKRIREQMERRAKRKEGAAAEGPDGVEDDGYFRPRRKVSDLSSVS
jgi:hypothetical protein